MPPLEINSVTPWGKLHKPIEPFYPRIEGAGRAEIGLARMLRMYAPSSAFGLSDEGIEDAFHESQAIRAFVGIDLGCASAPDATTLLKFRHLLEAKELTRQVFDPINGRLAEKGLDDTRGDHRGRDADRRAAVDEKQGRQARSGNAPIEETQ